MQSTMYLVTLRPNLSEDRVECIVALDENTANSLNEYKLAADPGCCGQNKCLVCANEGVEFIDAHPVKSAIEVNRHIFYEYFHNVENRLSEAELSQFEELSHSHKSPRSVQAAPPKPPGITKTYRVPSRARVAARTVPQTAARRVRRLSPLTWDRLSRHSLREDQVENDTEEPEW